MPCHLSSDMHPIHQVEPCKFAETAWHLIECHAMDAMDAWGHGGHACGRAPWIRGVGWGSDGGDRRSCYACEYRPEESGGEGVDVEVEERRHRMSRSRRAAILQDPVAN